MRSYKIKNVENKKGDLLIRKINASEKIKKQIEKLNADFSICFFI
jgi:hypothetical protein